MTMIKIASPHDLPTICLYDNYEWPSKCQCTNQRALPKKLSIALGSKDRAVYGKG